MASLESEEIARQAEVIYEQRLKTTLEQLHPNQYVAIEPVSGEHFLGRTLSEAISAARRVYPDRITYALRIGHRTAVHIGVWAS